MALDVEVLLSDVVAADFDERVVSRALDDARAVGQDEAFVARLLELAQESGHQLAVAALSHSGTNSTFPPSSDAADRITSCIKTVPFVGQRLAGARDAMSFLRSNEDDPDAVRAVKLIGALVTHPWVGE